MKKVIEHLNAARAELQQITDNADVTPREITNLDRMIAQIIQVVEIRASRSKRINARTKSIQDKRLKHLPPG